MSGLRATLILLGLAVAGAPGLAAQEVRLTVRIASESGPVAQADVSAGVARALSDDAGVARFVLPPGTHVVRVVALGYEEAEFQIVLRAAADTTVAVVLEQAPLEAEAILVLSTRGERRIEDEPLRVEVVAREEVEEKLLMTPGDIAMLLNETAGLRVQPTAPSLGGASVRIQGLRGRYTQILSDGLPLYGGQTGALGPLQIPPVDLGQVEVIKGAASALYGSTALGGVVNLISRTPEDEQEVLLNRTTLGGTDVVAWLARDGGSDDEEEDDGADAVGAAAMDGDADEGSWGYTLLAGAHRQDRADVDDDGWSDLPAFRRALARPRLFWEDGRGRSVFLTLGGMAEDREGGTVPGGTVPDGSPYAEELETRRLDVGATGRALLGESRLLTVRASAMTQAHTHTFGSTVERDRHTTAFGEAAIGGEDGRHVWVLGAALQHDRYAGRDVSSFDFAHTVPGLFAQDELTVAPWLVLAASARLDVHSEYGVFAAPRVSALLRPGAWVVRASGGSGWFGPTPFTEETEAVGLARLEPFADLEVERAWSGMLDVGRALGPWEVNATLFGSRIEDALVVADAPGGMLALANADGPVRTWGTELLARYEREPIHLSATYVHTRSTEVDPSGTGRREVPLTPRHAVGLVGALEDEERGRIGAEFYYTGRQELEENPYRARSTPYFVVGLLVEARFAYGSVFVNAENLLDARQTGYDRLVLPARSPDGRWITDVWAPLEGRAINGGVRLTF